MQIELQLSEGNRTCWELFPLVQKANVLKRKSRFKVAKLIFFIPFERPSRGKLLPFGLKDVKQG
jgi:hypothetical protein